MCKILHSTVETKTTEKTTESVVQESGTRLVRINSFFLVVERTINVEEQVKAKNKVVSKFVLLLCASRERESHFFKCSDCVCVFQPDKQPLLPTHRI